VFAFLLLCGVALASGVLARREWFGGGLVILWAFASLRSARHIPLYAVVAAPVVASEIAAWWASKAHRSKRRSLTAVLWDAGMELGQSRRLGIWAAALAALALLLAAPMSPIHDFPSSFPVLAVSQNLDRLAPPARMPRIFTSDQWGDYLIFRLYPRQRVFFDGRSDFYGPSLGADYKELMAAGDRWPELQAQYQFEIALLPLDWPLRRLLERDPGWNLVYRDKVAVLFVRRPEAKSGALKKNALAAECRSEG
ncbi:MAG: hypothetical protein JO336_14730, partial [Acidobacteriia bacterium]|nr:hypothetical protein [Terriglobia bacterium]